MKSIQFILKGNKFSYVAYGIFWLVSTVLLLLLAKGDEVLYLNDHKTVALNYFFMVLTRMGEAEVCVAACLVGLLMHWREGLFLTVCILFNSLSVQLLKRMVFSDFKRPGVLFGDVIHHIPGFELHTGLSFPSGHTTAGVTICFALSLLTQNQLTKLFLIALGLMVGVSRIYLGQHYLMDVYAGSVLAVLGTSLCYLIFNNTKLKFNENWNR